MPRRYFDYVPKFQPLQVFSTVSSWFMIFGLFLMIGNLFWGLKKGKKVGQNPWNAITLDWQIGNPTPSLYNFTEIPVVTKGPYEFEGEWVHE